MESRSRHPEDGGHSNTGRWAFWGFSLVAICRTRRRSNARPCHDGSANEEDVARAMTQDEPRLRRRWQRVQRDKEQGMKPLQTGLALSLHPRMMHWNASIGTIPCAKHERH
jgi:hypothetical protein